MRRVFENSVNPAHSTSIARPCDGGVSELFRSCFFALAMFSRRWRENIASVPAGLFSPCGLKTHGLQVRFAHPPNFAPVGQSPPGVPAGLLALWAKRTASRSAGADPPNCAPCGQSPPGVPAGLFSPFGLKTHMLQVRFAHPSNWAPCGQSPPGVPAGLLARWAKRTAFRFASLTLRTAPRAGKARPGFRPAYWPVGPNARPPGPLARTLRTAPRAGKARPGFRMAYFRPLGSKRTTFRFASLTLRNAPRAGVARPGVPHGFQARAGWTRVLVLRGC